MHLPQMSRDTLELFIVLQESNISSIFLVCCKSYLTLSLKQPPFPPLPRLLSLPSLPFPSLPSFLPLSHLLLLILISLSLCVINTCTHTLHCHQSTFPRSALPILTQDCHLFSHLHLFLRPSGASHLGLGIVDIYSASDTFPGGIIQRLVSFRNFGLS